MEGRMQDFKEGVVKPKDGGAPNYYSAKIFRKLHGNEENWAGGGGGCWGCASKTCM